MIRDYFWEGSGSPQCALETAHRRFFAISTKNGDMSTRDSWVICGGRYGAEGRS